MTDSSYRKEISVKSTPLAAYKALTVEFDKWWTAASSPVNSEGDMLFLDLSLLSGKCRRQN